MPPQKDPQAASGLWARCTTKVAISSALIFTAKLMAEYYSPPQFLGLRSVPPPSLKRRQQEPPKSQMMEHLQPSVVNT
jgi:hypothetical protein